MIKDVYYQNDAVFSIFDYYRSGKKGNPIVAMPQGSGKSVVIGKFISYLMHNWPNQKVIMLTHIKELIAQNATRLKQVWFNAPLGIHSAGLSQRDYAHNIIFGGVKSVYNSIEKHGNLFGYRDCLLIDEAHLVSDEIKTTYYKVIQQLKQSNPYLKIIGFTATPYRMKLGLLTEGSIFDDMCYDITSGENLVRLINEGYLSKLISRPTESVIDTSNLKIVAGEFEKTKNEIETEKVLIPACREMVQTGYNRKRWLVFTPSINVCEHTNEVLKTFGIDTYCVHSKKKKSINDEIIEAYRKGHIHCIVNAGKLTTGFDCPDVDYMGILRATSSPILWAQILGRGMRISPGKNDCLVSDFGGNALRLGPIDDLRLPQKPGKKRIDTDPAVRICEQCGTYNSLAARHCIYCGYEFLRKPTFHKTASDAPLIKGLSDQPKIDYFKVDQVFYSAHVKKNTAPMLKVMYVCGLKSFTEYVGIENSKAKMHAQKWWYQRHPSPLPVTTFEALQKISELKKPTGLRVRTDLKYPEILSVEWN